LGVHFPKLTSDQRYAAEVFNAVLGEGMSSRLFREVREKEGLVYGIRSVFYRAINYGYLEIWAGCDPQNKDKVVEIAKREFGKMEHLTKAELKIAKEQVISKAIINSEGSDEEALELISEEFATKAENVYKFEEKVNAVTLEDVQGLARDVKFSEFWVGS
jgi:predicted Zn-dependent peptidase